MCFAARVETTCVHSRTHTRMLFDKEAISGVCVHRACVRVHYFGHTSVVAETSSKLLCVARVFISLVSSSSGGQIVLRVEK